MGIILGNVPDITSASIYSGLLNYVYSNGVYTALYVPVVGPAASATPVVGPVNIDPFGQFINDSGQVVGSYVQFDGSYSYGAFLDTNGIVTPIQPPNSQGSAFVPVGLSNTGVIIGGTSTGSFVDDNGVFTTLNVPGAVGAVSYDAISNNGTIVGTYTDASGTMETFIATPVAVPEPAPAALLGTGLVGLAFVLRQRRRGAL